MNQSSPNVSKRLTSLPVKGAGQIAAVINVYSVCIIDFLRRLYICTLCCCGFGEAVLFSVSQADKDELCGVLHRVLDLPGLFQPD